MRVRRTLPPLAALLLTVCSEPTTAPTKPAERTAQPHDAVKTFYVGNGSAGLAIPVTALEFGDVNVNSTSPQQTVNITNASASPIVMSGVGGAPGGAFSGSQDCQGSTLNPGQSCHMFFNFNPTVKGEASATSSGSWNGQAFSITMHGTGVVPTLFEINATSLDYGDVQTSVVSAQQIVTIKNITSSSIVMSGSGGAPPGNFNGVQDCQGQTLSPGQACHMFFTFTPAAAGPDSSRSIGSWNGQAFNIKLKGNGVAPKFRVTPSSLEFGQVALNTASLPETVFVTNIGLSSVVMSGAGGAPPGNFNGVQDCQGQVLKPGDTCHIFYTFTPTAAGSDTSNSVGSWNGQGFNIALHGSGISGAPTALFRISPRTIEYADVQTGNVSAQQIVSIKNITSSPVVMSGSGGAPPGNFNGAQDCQGQTLNPGQVCHMFFTFSPAAAGPDSSASIGSWNGQAFNVKLRGNGVSPRFRVSPTGFDFSNVAVGTGSHYDTTFITNIGLSSVVMSGAGGAPPGNFNGAQDCQGQVLKPGDTCHIFYQFSPASAGPDSSRSIGSWNGQAFNIALLGNGVGGKLLVSPVGFDFGYVPVGSTSAQQTTNVKNVGVAPIVMAATGGTPGGMFARTEDCDGVTLNPGQTCHMNYTFSPTLVGPQAATSAGSYTSQAYSVALQGTGQTVYSFSGFLSPIDPFPEFQTVNAGSTVPVKFSLGDNFGLDILATHSPASGAIACGSTAEVNDTQDASPAGKSGLTYDPLTNTYKYAWKTKTEWEGTCRQLVLRLVDGSVFRANFQFK